MQNMDFYNGKYIRETSPIFEKSDPEYFSRTTRGLEKDSRNQEKKAVRMLTLIFSLVIVAFTTGLVLGIKFAGGSDKKIVDDRTASAVNDLGEKVSKLVQDINITQKPADKLYPSKEYPYVIQLDNSFRQKDFKPVATYLSHHGHTVIISKMGENSYKLYTGPYKTKDEARKNLNKFSGYKEYALQNQAKIIKRI